MNFDPKGWASWIPRDPSLRKPNHYAGMARIAWQNRDQLPYAWRILNHGVCDGCALGTAGMKDWTIDGVHLCMVRLELLRLNTAPALDPARLTDVSSLSALTSAELRDLGRLPEPMVRRRGDHGFRVVSWEEAYSAAAERIRATEPQRFAVYLTSRGILNEHYYAAQKAARAMGTNHVDNSARLCHAGSTAAMKKTLGYGASTCSYRDWLGSDLIVFFGSNTPSNQPVTTKYLYYARQQGTRVAVVNPFREPGLENYYVPSVTESAIFGTRVADDWYHVDTGGDQAFLTGISRVLTEEGWTDRDFISRSTSGYDEAVAAATAQSWESLEASSGATRAEMRRFAEMLHRARHGIFVWSMGLTQHVHGVSTVRALVNVALALGWVGRPHAGLMPIRGHSGVQGGAEVGCVPTLDEAQRTRFEAAWKFKLPEFTGLTAADMIHAAAAGAIDTFWITGGNFLETLPDPAITQAALARVGTRIHQDIVLTSMMLAEPAETVILFPATTRYESLGGGTETSTERRIIFSPEIVGRRVGTAKPEWEVFGEVAARVAPGRPARFTSSAEIRAEIGRSIPLYAGIEKLNAEGDSMQWGGELLFADGRFTTADGRAHFSALDAVARSKPDDAFYVSTRRGKQFNSMVQQETDPLTNASRHDVLISPEDAARRKLQNGDRVRLNSATGSFTGTVRVDNIKSGNLQVHWPEGNVLLAAHEIDPASCEPDYNAVVTLEKAPTSSA